VGGMAQGLSREKQEADIEAQPSVSITTASSRSFDFEASSGPRGGGVQIRELPPKWSLFRDHADSGSSRTGGEDARGK
jgi:hypothetical protein